MKIYLAHNYAAREYLNNQIVPLFTQLGHTITSRWITHSHLHPTQRDEEIRTDEDRKNYALMDLADLQDADMIIHFCDQFGSRPGKGKYIEFGMAYAHGHNKRLVVVGEWKNILSSIFYFLPGVERFVSVFDLIAWMKKNGIE